MLWAGRMARLFLEVNLTTDFYIHFSTKFDALHSSRRTLNAVVIPFRPSLVKTDSKSLPRTSYYLQPTSDTLKQSCTRIAGGRGARRTINASATCTMPMTLSMNVSISTDLHRSRTMATALLRSSSSVVNCATRSTSIRYLKYDKSISPPTDISTASIH